MIHDVECCCGRISNSTTRCDAATKRDLLTYLSATTPGGVPMTTVERIALAFLSTGLVSATVYAAETEVTIDSGLSPRLQPAAVVEIARGHLASPIQGVEIDATTGEARLVPTQPDSLKLRCTTLDKLVRSSNQAGGLDRSIVWLVEGQGTFVSHRGAPGSSSTVHEEGFLIIDDSSGEIRGAGSMTAPRGVAPNEEAPPQP